MFLVFAYHLISNIIALRIVCVWNWDKFEPKIKRKIITTKQCSTCLTKDCITKLFVPNQPPPPTNHTTKFFVPKFQQEITLSNGQNVWKQYSSFQCQNLFTYEFQHTLNYSIRKCYNMSKDKMNLIIHHLLLYPSPLMYGCESHNLYILMQIIRIRNSQSNIQDHTAFIHHVPQHPAAPVGRPNIGANFFQNLAHPPVLRCVMIS